MTKGLRMFFPAAALALGGLAVLAQERPPEQGEHGSGASSARYAVAPGTRFLVSTEEEMNSGRLEENRKIRVRTLEPLETASGLVVPPGAEILGHVSRVEPAKVTGRARIWLTFDEIHTRFGRLPIVADVVGVPGEHTVKQGSKEGEIEARQSRAQEQAEAAAAGAILGAAAGSNAGKGAKGTAIGAALGATAGFLASSGLGHELNLPKGTKLELELERALYLK